MIIKTATLILSLALGALEATQFFVPFNDWYIVVPVVLAQYAMLYLQTRANKARFDTPYTLLGFLACKLCGDVATRPRIQAVVRGLAVLLNFRSGYLLYQANGYMDDIAKMLLIRDATNE